MMVPVGKALSSSGQTPFWRRASTSVPGAPAESAVTESQLLVSNPGVEICVPDWVAPTSLVQSVVAAVLWTCQEPEPRPTVHVPTGAGGWKRSCCDREGPPVPRADEGPAKAGAAEAGEGAAEAGAAAALTETAVRETAVREAAMRAVAARERAATSVRVLDTTHPFPPRHERGAYLSV